MKTSFFLLLFVFLASGVSYSQENKTTSEDFIRIANKIAAHSEKISNVWLDFWSLDEPFLFMKYDSIVQVYNVNQKPKGNYVSIPSNLLVEELKGEAFKKKSYLPEYQDKKRSFPGLYKINDKMIYALEPKGYNDFNKIDFYLHESFHFYQREKANWKTTAGDTISIQFKTMVLDTMAQVKNPKYIYLQNYERNFLSKTLYLENEKQIISNLKKLVVVKTLKNNMLPTKAVDLMERYQRREGTATYVGLYSSAITNNLPKDSVYSKLQSKLHEPMTEFPAFPAKDQQFLRWPQYAIGAAYCIIFDKLGVKDWKVKIANGATIYDIAESRVYISKAKFKRIVGEILNHFKNSKNYSAV